MPAFAIIFAEIIGVRILGICLIAKFYGTIYVSPFIKCLSTLHPALGF